MGWAQKAFPGAILNWLLGQRDYVSQDVIAWNPPVSQVNLTLSSKHRIVFSITSPLSTLKVPQKSLATLSTVTVESRSSGNYAP